MREAISKPEANGLRLVSRRGRAARGGLEASALKPRDDTEHERQNGQATKYQVTLTRPAERVGKTNAMLRRVDPEESLDDELIRTL